MAAFSTKIDRIGLCGRLRGQLRSTLCVNADELAFLSLILEFNKAFDQREQSVVLADADVVARLPLGAALTSQYVAAEYVLAAKLLKTKPLRVRIAAVSG